MKYSILKPIIIGILLGAALFFMPFFILRTVVIVLIIGFIFRLARGRGFNGQFGYRGYHPAFADKIRNMSDEEYNKFKETWQYGGCGPKVRDNEKTQQQ